jgi:hypothetical protein
MSVVGSAQIMPGAFEGPLAAGKYEVRVPYRVITNNLLDDNFTVCSAPGLPRLFTSYSAALPSLRVREYDPRRISPANLVWRVEVIFRTPDLKDGGRGSEGSGGTGQENDQQFNNPLMELPTVKFHSTSREVLITQVYDLTTGTLKPPTATNGEPYDPPPKRLARYLTLEISRNEPIDTPQPSIAVAYMNAINSDVFWGMPPGTWMIKDISPERQVKQLPSGQIFPFLRTGYMIEAAGSWDIIILDYGTFYLVPNPTSPTTLPPQRTAFMTREGHPITSPLNGFGGPLPDRLPFTADAGANTIAVVGSGVGSIYGNGTIVTFTTLGTSVLPSALTAGQAYYVVNSNAAAPSTFQVALTLGGTPIALGTTGSGTKYVGPVAVYNTIRPYPWLPYSKLALPQSFLEVQ